MSEPMYFFSPLAQLLSLPPLPERIFCGLQAILRPARMGGSPGESMRVSRLLAVSVLLTLAVGAAAQSPVKATTHVLELIPAQAQVVVYFPDLKSLEAKWSKVVGHFGGKDGFLKLQRQTGIDPSRLGPGPILRVSFRASGAAETWVWLLPTKDP